MTRFSLAGVLCVFVGLSTLVAACSIRPIEPNAEYNSVVVVQDFFTSFFVLETDSRVVLFDAGFRTSRVEQGLADLGFLPSDVTDIFVSHGHSDHVAALSLLDQADTFGLAAEADILEAESGLRPTSLLSDGDLVQVDQLVPLVFH